LWEAHFPAYTHARNPQTVRPRRFAASLIGRRRRPDAGVADAGVEAGLGARRCAGTGVVAALEKPRADTVEFLMGIGVPQMRCPHSSSGTGQPVKADSGGIHLSPSVAFALHRRSRQYILEGSARLAAIPRWRELPALKLSRLWSGCRSATACSQHLSSEVSPEYQNLTNC
jgi:hypothetical protein